MRVSKICPISSPKIILVYDQGHHLQLFYWPKLHLYSSGHTLKMHLGLLNSEERATHQKLIVVTLLTNHAK